MNGDKYLLCRPIGGLNDTLCQIQKCWEYAERTKRTLILDTSRSCFRGDLSDYFQPRIPLDRVEFKLTPQRLSALSALACFPTEVQGQLGSYKPTKPGHITFDFRRSYRENVLVHEKGGGGIASFFALQRLITSPQIRSFVRERLKHLGDDYFAVHIRNTDYKTDYKSFFSSISREVERHRLLVCSDDANIVAFAKTYFTSSLVLSSSGVTDTGGRPLHLGSSSADPRKQALDMIVDLFALGRSAKLFLTPLEKNRAAEISGFSMLAQHLNQNKSVVDALLDLPCSSQMMPRWRLEILKKDVQMFLNRITGRNAIRSVSAQGYRRYLARRIVARALEGRS